MTISQMNHEIFKKKGPMKRGMLKKLVVPDGGLSISTKLTEYGAVYNVNAVVNPVISYDDQSKITGSRLVVRGPLFNCEGMNAQCIWPGAKPDLEVSFTVHGQNLQFSSAAPNVSEWLELRSLPSFKVTDIEGGEELDLEQVDEEDGAKDGACIRVVFRHISPIEVGVFLQVTSPLTTGSDTP